MNLKVEIHLFLNADDAIAAIEQVGMKLSDTLVELGYGNVAAEDPEDTKLTSVVILKAAEPDAWKDSADDTDTMSCTFPTTDALFVEQADAGGIIE